ncbi:hypothetical protein P5673_025141 [Acropora cervicornis]|uniref:Uncharacterized protein n=1 Tax=Acropora cervicornis TaxID=6130 RepID=A0AAD9Q337_ACRCE|nr:hypothetical protein P5673_025141 [Acropora cervicornis]
MFSLEAVYFNVILFVVLKERLAKLSYPFNKCADDGDVSTTSNECPTMKQKGCSCGCRVKSRSQLSCKQAEGRKKHSGQGCTESCRCFNYKNSFGTSINPWSTSVSKEKRKKILSSPPSLKRAERNLNGRKKELDKGTKEDNYEKNRKEQEREAKRRKKEEEKKKRDAKQQQEKNHW